MPLAVREEVSCEQRKIGATLKAPSMPDFRALLPAEFQLEIEVMETVHLAVSSAYQAAVLCRDWSSTSGHSGQHQGDLVADEAALKILNDHGFGVYSEESGVTRSDADLVAVVDPVDGSANVARGIPFWCSSVAVVDEKGPILSCLIGAPDATTYWAVRGGGAYRNEERLVAKPSKPLAESVVFLNGFPSRHLGWMQYRALGSAALELCLIASGGGDAFIDVSPRGLALWDYLGALVLLDELGFVVGDWLGRELYNIGFTERRHIVATKDQVVYDAIVSNVKGM